jgi:hypothetical protein
MRCGGVPDPPRPWLLPRDLLLTSDVRRMASLNRQPITRHTLIRWRAEKGFPEPVRSIKVGRGRRAQTVDLWDRRDVKAWLKANPPV